MDRRKRAVIVDNVANERDVDHVPAQPDASRVLAYRHAKPTGKREAHSVGEIAWGSTTEAPDGDVVGGHEEHGEDLADAREGMS